MFINNFDPVAIEIFSLEIRWYSLAYIIGILLGWYLAKKIFINNNIKNKFDDFITYVIIGLILGGRLGYVFFYNFDYYQNNLLDIFKIWQGGMSFHGGVIGIIIASFVFSKKNKVIIPGKLSALFLIFYSFFRYFVEYFREPDDQLGYLFLNLTMGQLISFVFFIIGLSLYYLKNDIKKKS